jgi:hypothetical protein
MLEAVFQSPASECLKRFSITRFRISIKLLSVFTEVRKYFDEKNSSIRQKKSGVLSVHTEWVLRQNIQRYKVRSDKTSGDITAGDICGTKRPQGQNVWKDKMSGGTKHPSGQNVRKTKHPAGQNIWRDKTSGDYI